MKNYRFKKFYKAGFSLVEIMVSFSILIIVTVIAGNFIMQGLQSSAFGYEQDTAVSSARNILNEIGEEIRESNQSDAGDYLLDIVNEQEFSFYSNIDDDVYIEKIRYFLDNNIFKKSVIKPSGSPLEYNVSNEVIEEIAQYIENQSLAIFSYYDQDNNLIADPNSDKNKIRLIKVLLKINVTPEKMPNDYNVIMDIMIRNLKNNL